MQLIAFEAAHLSQLTLQPAQQRMQRYCSEAYALALEAQCSFSLRSDTGQILACAGVVEEEPHRAYGWVLLSAVAPQVLVFIHKKIRRYLQRCPYLRVETVVDEGFAQGKRWMVLLGFEAEGRLQHFYGEGQHVQLYARTSPLLSPLSGGV